MMHHAYLLLHRAMALLPPTMIPNMEPTPLPSTGIWDQPEGLLPEYSAHTNAFTDNAQFPPHESEEEQAHLEDLVQFALPEPLHHVSAPSPDDLPDPRRFSTPTTTPAKRGPRAKTTPKAPAKRRRRTTSPNYENPFAIAEPHQYLDTRGQTQTSNRES